MCTKQLLAVAIAALLTACGGGGSGGGGPAGNASSEPSAPAPNVPTARILAADQCSVGYWGDSISALTAPLLDKQLHVKAHSVIGGTAQAAVPAFLQDPLAERFIVVEYLTNDANGSTPFEIPMRSMLDRIKAIGRIPVLTGASHGTTGNLAVHGNYDLLVVSLAKEYGAIYADWPGVPYAGAADLMPDGVHPNDGYQQRLADALSQAILKNAKECDVR